MEAEYIEDGILKTLRQADGAVGLPEMMRRMWLRAAHRRLLRQALRTLIDAGQIKELSNKHYVSAEAAKGGRSRQAATAEGRLSITLQGFGFVRVESEPGRQSAKSGAAARRDDTPRDIYVAERDLGTAMQDDRVLVSIMSRRGEKPSGKILEITQRAHAHMAGWFQRSGKRSGRVTPRDPRIGRVVDILDLPPEGWPEDFDWVMVQIVEYTPPPRPLVGKIVERLGEDGAPGIDVLLLVRDRGVSIDFPPPVEEEARRIKVDWTEELARRHDLRAETIVTIDPSTAKDFDDALSIERIGGGRAHGKSAAARWRLKVHIADVSYFIREGGEIDREAFERGTSIYPVDRVVPMLPERLSSDLCSLRPGEDRLAMTVEAEIDERGSVVRSNAYRSIIHSRHRLTYEEVQAVFDGSDPQTTARLADIAETLRELRDLARVLRARRIERGALDLDIPEVRVVFDGRGAPCDVRHAARLESHQVVEECMLLANEVVARRLTAAGRPMIYRVHEPAPAAQLERLEPMLKCFGIRANLSRGALAQAEIQSALEQAERLPAGHILRRLILRAMARAHYSPRNAGHFGLASACYCHFTSPIRRYPDLTVHRALGRMIDQPEPPGDAESEALLDDLETIARQSSDLERRAQQIEWDTTELKALEFMEEHLGGEFDGYVCGVQPYGLYVELDPYPVEGLIPLRGLPDDYYEIDELGTRLSGRRAGRQFRLASRVRVRIERIDLVALQMDLSLADDGGETGQENKKPYREKGKPRAGAKGASRRKFAGRWK